ncbi:hypothetical protein B0H14DRAFT_3688331 [Mycena olivaceomarginata]|nr:hypothetical protein B0H14DRAFT_3688331 [Mycena olivaceomarginata]
MSAGKEAAVILLPLSFVLLLRIAFLKISRTRVAAKCSAWSEQRDERMSTIFADWKSITSAASRRPGPHPSLGGHTYSHGSRAFHTASYVGVDEDEAGGARQCLRCLPPLLTLAPEQIRRRMTVQHGNRQESWRESVDEDGDDDVGKYLSAAAGRHALGAAFWRALAFVRGRCPTTGIFAAKSTTSSSALGSGVEGWVGHAVDQREKVGGYTLGCNDSGRSLDLSYSNS